MPLPNIGDYAEFVERLFNDFAKAIREKRWVRVQLLVGFLYGVLLNPPLVQRAFGILGRPKPDWYSYRFWIVVLALFFVIAFIFALLTKRKPNSTGSFANSIIKGLLPYTTSKEDAEWFARLERGAILKDVLRFCLAQDSSLAILSGESGSGKTSFLQASLYPELSRQGQRPVFVKMTDAPPLESIIQSLEIDGGAPVTTLLAALQRAATDKSNPTVLILDQFEQFFTQNKNKSSRRPFVQQMAEWHRTRRSLPVKILVSIRDDFADRMTEFQKEMEYTLTAHNKLRLERFEPHQAAKIIEVIAGEAAIEIDREFVRDLTVHELADREEGCVSPVDIQILSWMLDAQNRSEERAFSRKAFQRLGGVEGLLERFLSRQLDAREKGAPRQAAVKVMLALTDQNVRAGALTSKGIKEKLRGILSDKEVDDAIGWLAGSEVRLITSAQDRGVTRYELAHERVIAPLRRLAFKEITDFEKAQQTLDRRVNEWIGNGHARRYLLTLREFRLITRNLKLNIVGSQTEQKAKFISSSRRRLAMRGASLSLILLFGTGGYAGYRWYEQRSETQIRYAQRRLLALLDGSRDRRAMEYSSLLLSVLDPQRDKELSQGLWERINKLNPADRAYALRWLGKSYLRMSKEDAALSTFDEARREARKFGELDQGYLLISLADNYGHLSKTNEAAKGLADIEEMAHESDNVIRTQVFISVAYGFGNIARCEQAKEVMKESLNLVKVRADLEGDSFYVGLYVDELKEWLEGYVRLRKLCGELPVLEASRKLQVAKKAAEKFQSEGKSLLLDIDELQTTLNESQKPISLKPTERPSDEFSELFAIEKQYRESSQIEEALKTLQKIESSANNESAPRRADLLFKLAEEYTALARPAEALSVLERVRVLIETDSSLSHLQWHLATNYVTLSKVDEALRLLDKVEAVDKPDQYTLVVLIDAFSRQSNADMAIKGLNKVKTMANSIPKAEQADLLPLLAHAYGTFSQVSEAMKILNDAAQAASDKQYNIVGEDKASTLTTIAVEYVRLGKWKEAVDTVESIGNELDKVSAFVKILITSKETKDNSKLVTSLGEFFGRIKAAVPE